MTNQLCRACKGTGESSREWQCVPCGGTGYFLLEKAQKPVKRKRQVKGHRQAGKKTNKSRKMLKKIAKKKISKRFLKKKKEGL